MTPHSWWVNNMSFKERSRAYNSGKYLLQGRNKELSAYYKHSLTCRTEVQVNPAMYTSTLHNTSIVRIEVGRKVDSAYLPGLVIRFVQKAEEMARVDVTSTSIIFY